MTAVRSKRWMARLMAVALPIPLLVTLGASPSSAAVYCSTSQGVWTSGPSLGYAQIPVVRVSGGHSRECNLTTAVAGKELESTRALQTALNVCYGMGLKPDGHYGTKTSNAMKIVQGRIGTTADGKYGPNTRKKMRWPTTFKGAGAGCNFVP